MPAPRSSAKTRSAAPSSAAATAPAAPARSAAAKSSPPSLQLAQARAIWHLRQGLAAPAAAPIDAILAATSWPRTLGGIDVYLSTRARVDRLRRADLDAAVERREVQVVPAIRGCIYLVPRQHAALCLRVAEDQWRPRTEREIQKAGTTWAEIDEVAAAARQALAQGALTPDGLRRALPAGSIRSLGEAGKKVGISSPLPLALRVLEFAGQIERTLPGGHLDSERYEWRLAAAPATPAPVPATAAERARLLAEIFFAGAAPATVKDFAGWAGLSQRDAQQAVHDLPLQPVKVPGYSDQALAFAEDLKAVPASQTIAFLPFEDNYLTIHGGLCELTDPAYHDRLLPVWGGGGRTSPLAGSKQIPLRPILLGPEVVGFWEYDPDAQRVVYALFAKSAAAVSMAQAAESLTAFLRDELHHGRSFSLDTDDELRLRTKQVQQVGA